MSAIENHAGEPLPAIDPSAATLRTTLVGDRVTIAQAAAAIGVTERAVYKSIAEHSIPFVKVLGTRYLDPADLSRALIKQHNTPPRGRGRPPKSTSNGLLASAKSTERSERGHAVASDRAKALDAATNP